MRIELCAAANRDLRSPVSESARKMEARHRSLRKGVSDSTGHGVQDIVK